MSKRSNESFLEYQKRVMDPISGSFCAAKWLNATIWLGSGATSSCHLPPAHKIDKQAILKDPAALHNTEHKKRQRAKMLRGERPKECEYCWRIEDMGRGAVSDRVFKTVIYDEDSISKVANLDADSNSELQTLEIAFDRICNFACSYCNASFSTVWARDIRKNGPYQDLVSDGAQAYQHAGDWVDTEGKDSNPYVAAFWEWWPELRRTLKELRITGGEPLLSPHVWRLFDYFTENGSEGLTLALNSNLGVRTDLIEKLIQRTTHIQAFDLYTSNESVGLTAEYIRDGLNYADWQKNVENILLRGNVRTLNVMLTVNALCLYSLPNLLNQLLSWKNVFGRDKVVCSVNILRFPSFLSPLTLPDFILRGRKDELAAWLSKNGSNSLLHEHELAGLERLLSYLEVVDRPHFRASVKSEQQSDLRSFLEQYDRRRQKDYRDVFPSEFNQWLQTVAIQARACPAYVDGAAHEGIE